MNWNYYVIKKPRISFCSIIQIFPLCFMCFLWWQGPWKCKNLAKPGGENNWIVISLKSYSCLWYTRVKHNASHRQIHIRFSFSSFSFPHFLLLCMNRWNQSCPRLVHLEIFRLHMFFLGLVTQVPAGDWSHSFSQPQDLPLGQYQKIKKISLNSASPIPHMETMGKGIKLQ